MKPQTTGGNNAWMVADIQTWVWHALAVKARTRVHALPQCSHGDTESLTELTRLKSQDRRVIWDEPVLKSWLLISSLSNYFYSIMCQSSNISLSSSTKVLHWDLVEYLSGTLTKQLWKSVRLKDLSEKMELPSFHSLKKLCSRIFSFKLSV